MSSSKNFILQDDLYGEMIEHYFHYGMQSYPQKYGRVAPNIIIDASMYSEHEKENAVLNFMNHVAEEYNENPICFEFPRHVRVEQLDIHFRIGFSYFGSLSSTIVPPSSGTIVLVYNSKSRQHGFDDAVSIMSLRPRMIFLMD